MGKRRVENRPREKLSLWLAPSGREARRLQSLIRILARRHGTPDFAPHVTLLGGIRMPRREAIRKTARLAMELPPLRLEARRIVVGRTYFRALFLDLSGGTRLAAARRSARRAFGETAKRGRFRPHLSLRYGPAEVRAGAHRRDAARAADARGAETLAEAAALVKRLDRSFEVRRLLLVRTGANPLRWRVLSAARLGGRIRS